MRLQDSGISTYMATTTETEAQALINLASKLGVSFTIGPLDDVLTRFYICAREHELDVIIRVTSDCPLIDGQIIKKALDQYLKTSDWKKNYLSNTQVRQYPRGMDFEIFSFELLKEAHLNGLKMYEREHVTPYFYKNPNSSAQLQNFFDSELTLDASRFRITVDTKQDFELIKELIETYNCESKDVSGIIAVMENNPTLALINQSIIQKSL